MQRKGRYTGRRIKTPHFRKFVTVGKISGFTGTGTPVYDLRRDGKKVGELNSNFIRKYIKEYGGN